MTSSLIIVYQYIKAKQADQDHFIYGSETKFGHFYFSKISTIITNIFKNRKIHTDEFTAKIRKTTI